ncbi:MAG: response regulator, partial [Bacteroidetes bacterium]|nr:response regulator [Bacteroidota bacterium]
ETESDSKSRELSIFIGLLILSLILTILLSIYLITLISGSMATLKKAADRVRLGSTDVVIDINSTDEIGEVAQSFKGVVRKNISLTRVVQAIGKGNYDVEVEVLSKDDLLSGAISEMKDNLQFYTRESANRSWIMSGIAELNNLISSANSLEQVTATVVSYLCSYTRSESGLLYLHHEGGVLHPAASHGISVGLEQISSFHIGTGQLGQAVSEKKAKILEDIPHKFMNHTSGLATITPASIIILPLTFTDNIVGAIELSARHQYSDLEFEFLKNAAERISILINNLTTHLRTQELLYETQNQAEELETQQEELRQLNAELRASEEELKVSQEELQEKNSELEEKAQLLEEQFEAVRNKNQALEDARQAIELKMEQVETVSKYKSDFLANMSHELRTPLNSILILSRLLADNTDQNLSEKQEEHARIIHRSGSDLLKLINEILDLSKIESGQLKLELEDVSIKELAIQDMFKDLAVSKKINFEVKLEEGLPDSFTTDRFRLEQILKNFLSNAFKFTPEGGNVTLTIYPLKQRKSFQSEQLNQQQHILAFKVSDTGIGISEEKQGLVFEAFQQADTSTTRRFGGSGLGLTISRELAILLGGEIELQSEEGKGSTFTLYVPAQLPSTQQQLKAKPTSAENLQTRVTSVSQVFDEIKRENHKEVSLLIIEDDPGFNGVLADFSLAKNYVVHQAYTGQDGLDLARKIKPDALLLDINLPDISGWEVLKQIRETQELRHVNVHVMSAYDREVIGNYHENEEYLPKPVTLEMLNKAFTTISQANHRSIKKILIVEDNETENKAIAELLLAHGLESISAYDALEAEQLLARQKIDCIILDINLPGIKGNEWMETIRARKGLAEIPIIIYSGKELNEAEEAALKQHANTVIIKNEYSYVRLLDEVQLFLHKVNQKLPTGKDFKMKLHVPEEILQNKKALVVDDDIRNVYSLHNLL